MKKLIKKYRANTLSPQDLKNLRQQMAETDDEQLAVLMEDDWLDADADLRPWLMKFSGSAAGMASWTMPT